MDRIEFLGTVSLNRRSMNPTTAQQESLASNEAVFLLYLCASSQVKAVYFTVKFAA